MSTYTTELRYICEGYAGLAESVGFDEIDAVVNASVGKIFNFSFPIFDESYRYVLCTKILKTFYTREICEETVGLWKLRLSQKLNLIMPYYNQLYKSELLDFNPLYDVDLTRTHDGTRNQDANTNTNSTSGGTTYDLFSDTPQNGLSGVNDEDYLTTAEKITSNQNQNQNTSGNLNTLENYSERVMGANGGASMSTRLKEFRQTFLNIDALIMGELEPLFFGLW